MERAEGHRLFPPHFADPERPTVSKALDELNALRAEIAALLSALEIKATPLPTAGAA